MRVNRDITCIIHFTVNEQNFGITILRFSSFWLGIRLSSIALCSACWNSSVVGKMFGKDTPVELRRFLRPCKEEQKKKDYQKKTAGDDKNKQTWCEITELKSFCFRCEVPLPNLNWSALFCKVVSQSFFSFRAPRFLCCSLIFLCCCFEWDDKF